MLGYAIAFLLGGYIIPASMHFGHIYIMDRKAPDHPSRFESFVTAFVASVVWPTIKAEYIGK